MPNIATTAEQAIGLAEELFLARNRRWARFLVDFMERRRPLLAFHWATRQFSNVAFNRQQTAWTEWLTELQSVADNPTPQAAHSCEDRAREIWTCGGPVSLIRRGISRLFGALALFINGNEPAYRLELTRAMCLLVDEIDDHWSREVFDKAISSFRDAC